MKTSTIFQITFSASIGIFSLLSEAHKNHPHGHDHQIEQPEHQDTKNPGTEVPTPLNSNFQTINEAYVLTVKPIFQKSCFDCHSQSPRLPWYGSVPLVQSLLEKDMNEAKEHLDFSFDFPFRGHGTPSEDLQAIAEVITDGSMPPFRYRAMHWSSQLSSEDRKIILNWTQASIRLISDK